MPCFVFLRHPLSHISSSESSSSAAVNHQSGATRLHSSRGFLVSYTRAPPQTSWNPCAIAASQVVSIKSWSIFPTSWWVQPSSACTSAPAWQACTQLRCIVISHVRNPRADLGSRNAGRSVYWQSLRSSGMGGTTNWWKVVPAGACRCSFSRKYLPTTHVSHCAPSSRRSARTRRARCSGELASFAICSYRSKLEVYMRTSTPRAER
mmetsp:Transcript_30914/g.100646  ORF Transcript_30914/g.100646 Transcript_30914/m.100646 type:complete len:207 (-) Transcript_30914:1640-2260(-)